MSCQLSLRISARASRDAIMGWHGDALKISITTAPEKGKANKAILKLLAGALGTAPSRISVVRGQTSPDKIVDIQDLSEARVHAALNALLDNSQSS